MQGEDFNIVRRCNQSRDVPTLTVDEQIVDFTDEQRGGSLHELRVVMTPPPALRVRIDVEISNPWCELEKPNNSVP